MTEGTGETADRITRDQCREYAKACRDMAARAQNSEHKVTLLNMAETWDKLAALKGDDSAR